jgi:trans-2,3-dihydro-3-hydroxyanthranilate isomerase
MERKYSITQIDAFTDKPFKGNPAGVMFADGVPEAEKQSIAKEMNLSETAFLSKSGKADYKLQWFTPAVEVELCGHATIASLHFLLENGLLKSNQSVRFETLSGVLNCGFNGTNYYMQIPVPQISVYKGERTEILNALGVDEDETDSNIPWLILPSGYLYIYFKKLSSIGKLTPDFNAVKKINLPGYGIPQIVAFTLETVDKADFAHSRFFAPGYGLNEDPVTGSANGPFMLALNKLGFLNFENDITVKTFEQGDFVEREGRVTVQYDKIKNELYISGKAITVLRGEIIL